MISIITITVLVLAESVRMETCDEIKQLKIIDFNTKVAVDINKDCGPGTKPCVIKCCTENKVLFKIPRHDLYVCKSLKELSKEYNSTDIQPLSNYSIKDTDTGEQVSFFEDFRILYSDRFVNKMCSSGPAVVGAYITKNGTSYYQPNENDPPVIKESVPDFCMDKLIGLTLNGLTARNGFYFRMDDSTSMTNRITFSAYGALVSAFLLLLVFVIHCLLKYLHGTIKGKLLMGFMFNMMLHAVYNAWYYFSILDSLNSPQTTEITLPACKWLSPIGYFLFVSAFFWLNAMCYDIWRKFRSSKLKSLNDKKKMRLYSAYAISMPLLCTVICLLIEQYGSEELKPGFDTCSQDDDNLPWKRLYEYLPTGLIILCNAVMWILTVRNVRSVHVEYARTARRESTNTRKGLSNVYRKLFILMGVIWLIEVIVVIGMLASMSVNESAMSFNVAMLPVFWALYFLIPVPNLEDWAYYLTNIPGTLIGVWVFLATVCNKDIFIKLCISFGIENKWTQNITTTQVSQVTSGSRAKAKRNKDSYRDGQEPDAGSKI